MDVLPLHFGSLRFFGFWHETTKPHWLVKYIWKPFVISVIVIFTTLQLAAMKVYRDDVKDLTDCVFISSTYVGLCLQLLNLLGRRDAMNELLSEFRGVADVYHRPRDVEESEITAKFRKNISMVFYSSMAIAQLSGFALYFLPLLPVAAGNAENWLPFKTYELYDRQDPLYYWVTYVFEVVAAVISIFVDVALETMLAGFTLLTCRHIDLCCRRFSSSSVEEFIGRQLSIWTTVRKIQSFFMPVVVPMMFLSSITLCASIYNMSKLDIGDADWLFHLSYFGGMLFRLFYYCWVGSELRSKSTAIRETIYNSDWTTLKPLDRKKLCLIMVSCQREMSFSFHGICAISLDLFVRVLNTSYAAYNLLKKVDARYG